MNLPAALLTMLSLVIPTLAIELPPPGGQYDSQLGGAYTPPAGTKIVSRDRTDPPAAGLYNICYVNAFQTQPSETEWWLGRHPDLLLRRADGSLVEDANWPGEILLDTSTDAKRAALVDIVAPWIEGCAASGYQAIEADNLDTFSRAEGLLVAEDNLAYAQLLIETARASNLAFGQKNAVALLEHPDLPPFDFAIVESCEVYAECDAYAQVYGARVLEIEYTDTDPKFFDRACTSRGATASVILRDRDLQPSANPDHVYRTCKN